MKLVLASNNRSKLAELQAMLAPLGVELIPQAAELGVGEAEEPFHLRRERTGQGPLCQRPHRPAGWPTMPACA